MTACSDIGLSRKHRVFAVKESVCGTLQFPTGSSGASLGVIIPAGNAIINQKPEMVDSEEIINSLDILSQFQSAVPPGSWSVPMYLRPDGTIGNRPQGSVLFESMQGSLVESATASISAALSTTGTSIAISNISERFPEKGVVTVGTEKIYYGGISRASHAATNATLTSLTRGFKSTSAAGYSSGEDVALSSLFYKQNTTTPSFSLWVETDHFVQGLSGCAVNSATFSVNKQGAVMLNFDGSGMKMVYAGKCTTVSSASSTSTLVSVTSAYKFSVDARVYNSDNNDHNSSAGYTVSRVDTVNHQIAVSPALATTWASGATIRGYLPASADYSIGTPIESRYTDIEIDSVAGKFKESDISIDCPKEYISDEVGTEYAEAYVENTRSITSNMDIYFRKDDATYVGKGFEGNEIPILVSYGQNNDVELYFKRARLETPEVNVTAPTVSLSMPWKALGTVGEDSFELIFNT